jgi:hypothetical protein
MAVTDPSAISFANNYVRPAADKRAQDYYFAKATLQQWNSGLSALFPNDATVIADGAAPNGTSTAGGDGRRLIKGSDVNNVINRCQEIVTDFEATGSAKLTTILAVAVNPGS